MDTSMDRNQKDNEFLLLKTLEKFGQEKQFLLAWEIYRRKVLSDILVKKEQMTP